MLGFFLIREKKLFLTSKRLLSLAPCVCLCIWSQINLEAEAGAVSWVNWGFFPLSSWKISTALKHFQEGLTLRWPLIPVISKGMLKDDSKNVCNEFPKSNDSLTFIFCVANLCCCQEISFQYVEIKAHSPFQVSTLQLQHRFCLLFSFSESLMLNLCVFSFLCCFSTFYSPVLSFMWHIGMDPPQLAISPCLACFDVSCLYLPLFLHGLTFLWQKLPSLWFLSHAGVL